MSMNIRKAHNQHDPLSVERRVVLITGGYGLLGRHFAHYLKQNGATPIIAGRRRERLEAIAKEIECPFIEMDVSNADQVRSAVQEVYNQHGSIDALINGASFSYPAEDSGKKRDLNFIPFEEITREDLMGSLEIDLMGTVFCCQAVGQVMKAQKKPGSIVNLSSIYERVAPQPDIYQSLDREGQKFFKASPYGLAKSGAVNLSRYLAVYWREHGIRVNTLTLGGVLDGQDAQFVERYAQKTPLGRMADPDEFNGAIRFLVSDASSYMTGSNLIIDGGWTAW